MNQMLLPENVQLALDGLSKELEWRPDGANSIAIHQSSTALFGPRPIADMASAVYGMLGLAMADIHRVRGGLPQDVVVDRQRASMAMRSSGYMRVNGNPITDGDPITGYYPTSDGQWIFLHGNFPHLREGLLDLLHASDDRISVEQNIQCWTADGLEEAAATRGLCALKRRTRAQWETHAQFAAVNAAPLVSVRKMTNSDPVGARGNSRPLDNIRVLDLTRVLAGPMCGRTLAEHGASVLRVNAPHLPYMKGKSIDTGFGKYSCFLDLRQSSDNQQLRALSSKADVFIDGYRPGALASHGFSPESLSRNGSSIVYVSISAFSDRGPWGGRRGYDSLIQSATGFTTTTLDSPPTPLPCQPLDYMTGCLAALGTVIALHRRAEEGGSWKVEVSLARTATWVWKMFDLLEPERRQRNDNMTATDASMHMFETASAFGIIRALKPPIEMSLTAQRWRHAPVPVGSDSPCWP